MSNAVDTWRDRTNLVVFESIGLECPWTLETYQKIGGY